MSRAVAFVAAASLVAVAVVWAAADRSAVRSIEASRVGTIRPPGNWDILRMTFSPGERVLVVSSVPRDDGDAGRHLWTVSPRAGSRWRRLLTRRSLCSAGSIVYHGPVAVGARELVVIEACIGEIEKYVRTYSFSSRSLSTRYPYTVPFPARDMTFAPNGVGLLNDGTGLFERLRWLWPKRLSQPIRLGLERVGNIGWSPDGRVIAVGAVESITGIGADGPMRSVLSRFFVRLSGPTLHDAVRRVPHLEYRSDGPYVAWSRDSRTLAVAGQTGKNSGAIHLIRVRDMRIVRVARERYRSIVWVNDHTIAAVRSRDYNTEGGDTIDLLDVGSALNALRD